MPISICSLASGSSGNATYIATERTAVLVDCGLPSREIVSRLESIGGDPTRIDGILITHAHVDHYRSAGTLNRRFGIPVYVDPTAAKVLAVRGQATSWKRLQETRPLPERIGDLEIQPVDTSHGGASVGRTVAFLMEHGGRRVGVVTDLGHLPDETIRALRGLDAILLEANYDTEVVRDKLRDPAYAADWPYLSWIASESGHLSNRQCAEALAACMTKRECHVFLGHLSENHQDPARDNNSFDRAAAAVRELLRRERLPIPHLHRTFRRGLEPGKPSVLIEIG